MNTDAERSLSWSPITLWCSLYVVSQQLGSVWYYVGLAAGTAAAGGDRQGVSVPVVQLLSLLVSCIAAYVLCLFSHKPCVHSATAWSTKSVVIISVSCPVCIQRCHYLVSNPFHAQVVSWSLVVVQLAAEGWVCVRQLCQKRQLCQNHKKNKKSSSCHFLLFSSMIMTKGRVNHFTLKSCYLQVKFLFCCSSATVESKSMQLWTILTMRLLWQSVMCTIADDRCWWA